MKINAIKARLFYFESHVEFECLIREIHWNIFQKNDFKPSDTINESKNKKLTLADLIRKIASSDFFPMLQTKESVLSDCKNNRNWLAHTCKQKDVKNTQIESFKNVQAINDNLKKALIKIKERHPRSGRANMQ